MVAAARGEAYEIPFGGSLQLQYVADAGEAFVRASEARVEGASVHNLDGPVVIGGGDRGSDRGGGAGRADHLRRGPAALPAGGGLDVVHRPDRRPDRPPARGGRGAVDRAVQGGVSTAPSDAEPTEAA